MTIRQLIWVASAFPLAFRAKAVVDFRCLKAVLCFAQVCKAVPECWDFNRICTM